MNNAPLHSIKKHLKGWLRKVRPDYNRRLLINDLRQSGEALTIGAGVTIQYPEVCLIGNHVSIGKSSQINHFGGVVIADHTTIGEQVQMGNPNPQSTDLPIVIGRNCIIEDGVHIPSGRIIENNTIVSKDGITKNPKQIPEKNTSQATRFFIVSTGAAGSRAIAKSLSQHSTIDCKHEANSLLISLSSAYEYGKITRDYVRRVLQTVYCKISTPHNLLIGESDQKLGNLIPILAELLPNSRFIWIRRNAYSFVESTAVKKSWYSEQPVDQIPFVLGQLWATHRLNGFQCGAFTAQAWAQLSPVEKNAWYWQYWNSMIERDLMKLPPHRYMTVHLESLAEEMRDLTDFLGVASFPFALFQDNIGITNQVKQASFIENKEKISHYCSEGMAKWYPEYKNN